MDDTYFKNYLGQKQLVFDRYQHEVLERAQRDGETVSCVKSCYYCCLVYVEATPQECSAIACYLQKNKELLESFLEKYPDWLKSVSPYGERCNKMISFVRKEEQIEGVWGELSDALLFYKLLKVPCPFLNESVCSIYPVRPFTCAAHFAVTPPQWCSPGDKRTPKVYMADIGIEIEDRDYVSELTGDNELTHMPVKVFEILRTLKPEN